MNIILRAQEKLEKKKVSLSSYIAYQQASSTNSRPSSPLKDLYKKPNISIRNEIGKGSFGVVYACKYENNLMCVKKALQNKYVKNREIEIFPKLQHTNIVKYISHYFDKIGNELYLFVIMEKMQTSLDKLICSTFSYNTQHIFKQILKGLEYLHSRNIMHRDLKPSNILFNMTNESCKLCDFGSSKIYDGSYSEVNMGTVNYRAPELLFQNHFYDHQIDIWSFGCIVWELEFKIPLFIGYDTQSQITSIIHNLGIPTQFDLVKFKINIDDVKNIVYNNEYKQIKKNLESQSLLNLSLIYNPILRSNATELLLLQYFHNTPQTRTKVF